jgi:GDPmannose 4,6-dehydratase
MLTATDLLRIIESVRFKAGLQRYIRPASVKCSARFRKCHRQRKHLFTRDHLMESKAAAYYMARVYRESYGMKIYCGFLFNHESERRGEEFLSRKVCKAVAEIKNGLREKLVLGNLDAKRDFGYAKEYVEWIWNIVQHEIPDDFVIATG